MSTYRVLVTEPNRAKKWLAAIGTQVVPVQTAMPVPVTLGTTGKIVTRDVYEVNTDALTPDQLAGLVKQKAQEWHTTAPEALEIIKSVGVCIQAAHCMPAKEPKPDRPAREAEFQVEPGDTQDVCYACGKPVLWHRLPTGKFILLSVETLEQDLTGNHYALSHFAECPNAYKSKRKEK